MSDTETSKHSYTVATVIEATALRSLGVTATSHRLPDGIRPSRYDLELRPDLVAGTFDGSVRITVTVDDPAGDESAGNESAGNGSADRIVLHALDLDITGARSVDGEIDLDVEHVGSEEQIVLSAPGGFAAGEHVLALTFRGVLNDQLVGFYRSNFTSTDAASGAQVEHTLAVTQFESTHARRAFPCFDEPALKAVFSISLVVPGDLLAVSNSAEVARDELGDGLVRVRFADTMVMSTYLVAFVVGPLEVTATRMVEGAAGPIPLRIVHPPGTAALTEFALDVAEHGLRYFEQYYGLPYPGDKVDLVAVPDFAFGAMENLGCITFREVLLLIDPTTSTPSELQRVADVIHHELAHMWFGDLVTMKWWNGIWLNEAFATFMEVMASDSFRPEWDVWTTFGLARAAAFDTDALGSTRPIEYEVVTAADSEGMFDILTYEKGASVVRMLEQYLGAEQFRAGISSYLHRHAYGCTETTDLWDALEEVTGEPVRRIMDNWIFRGGHPAVEVTATDTGVELTQSRFRYTDPTDGADEDAPWPIPVVLAATGDGEHAEPSVHRVLLEGPATVVLGHRPRLVQANVAGSGFYRTFTDPELRAALAGDTTAGALERFVLLDDTVAGHLAGRVSADEVLDLIARLAATETDPSVWRRIASATHELVRLAGPDHDAPTRAAIVALAVPALARFDRAVTEAATEHDGGPTARQLEVRAVLVSMLGVDGRDAATRDRARQIFEHGGADASLTVAAISVVAADATEEEHAELERRWRGAGTPQDELRYLTALVDTDDEERFDHALDLAVDEVRTQNAPYLLRRAIAHPTLGSRAWRHITDRWELIGEKFPSNSLPRMLEGIRSICDRATAEQVEAFLDAHPLPSGERTVAQHVERMWVSVAAAERTAAGRTDATRG